MSGEGFPDFFVVGAAKAGTTSLYRYLGQHDGVFLPVPKEPGYFLFEGRPPAYAGPWDREVIIPTLVWETQAYRALFAAARPDQRRGDCSVAYLATPGVAERIRARRPDARIVVVLRDPAERAFSHWRMTRANGHEGLDLADALRAEPDRLAQGWSYLYAYRTMGFYHRQVSEYLEAFGPSQVLVLWYEDLVEDAAGTVRRVLEFLGLDTSVPVDTSERFNVGSSVPRSATAEALARRGSLARRAARRVVPRAARRRVLAVADRVLRREPALDPAIRRELVEGYRDDLEALERLTGRDLSAWRTA